MTIYDLAIAPFMQDMPLRHALAACAILSLAGPPLGVFLNMRRMPLVGDAMSHAILPGVALAFMFFGMSLWLMTAAAMGAGIIVALLGFYLTRVTQLKEDASFTLIYMMSLAAGVVMITRAGGDDELIHVLFGETLSIDAAALHLIAGAACLTLVVLSQIYRELLIDCFDPDFLRTMRKGRSWTGQIFFILLVINLVAAFKVLGTLMALGLILLPAIAARFWTRSVDGALAAGIGLALVSSYTGLLAAHHLGTPEGPSVVLAAGSVCLLSAVFGHFGSIRHYMAGNAQI